MKDAKCKIKSELNDKMKTEQGNKMKKEHSKVLKTTPLSEQINLILNFFMFKFLSLDFKRDMIYGLEGRLYCFPLS